MVGILRIRKMRMTNKSPERIKKVHKTVLLLSSEVVQKQIKQKSETELHLTTLILSHNWMTMVICLIRPILRPNQLIPFLMILRISGKRTMPSKVSRREESWQNTSCKSRKLYKNKERGKERSVCEKSRL